ncbi:PIN domain-containing protein [Variovorax sp. W2I14]|uniref:PIN domain-containing protein n=1 Tax=Variovorax sp. W2I14 TaxID=3042290 RepID=UPI003D263004
MLNLLGRSKLADRIVQASLSPQILVDDLRKLAIVVTPTNVPRVVPTDPDDDHVLPAALAGAADLIPSGDRRDLLPLGNYAGIPIVSARQAMERIAPR